MQNKFTAIIQLRNNSSRLKNKHFLKINDLPIINYLYQTLDSNDYIDRIIFSTSKNKDDDIIENYCKKNNYEYFRGDEENVLLRIADTITKMNVNGDYIIKFWGDSPIITNDVCNYVIGQFLLKHYGIDYISNNHPNTYPEGMQLEIIKKSLIVKLSNTELNKFHTEHVTTVIWMNPDTYTVGNVVKLNPTNSKYRMVLDYCEDYLLIKKLLEKFNYKLTGIKLSDLEKYLDQNPEIMDLNKNYIESEEAYYKRILGN